RLRPGDRIGVGRSLLLFGSEVEIAERIATISSLFAPGVHAVEEAVPPTVHNQALAAQFDHDLDFDLNARDKITASEGNLFLGKRPLPPLPLKLPPSQAARLAELLDFLHRHLTAATENIRTNDEATQVVLSFADWQRVLAVQMILARYVRAV